MSPRALPILLLSLITLPAAAAAQTFEHRWAGVVFDIHAPTADDAWTVEDGGRIRRTSDGGNSWTFDVTPIEAEHILRGIHVLADLTEGWAVGEDSTILHNPDMSLTTWNKVTPSGIPTGADLYDVFFADGASGWLLAVTGLWYTTDGGSSWDPVILLDDAGMSVDLTTIELYAMDIKELSFGICYCDCAPPPCICPLTPTFGLACAEPGFIYRTLDGITWKEVFDIQDYCNFDPDTPECAKDKICPPYDQTKPFFEPWDIEISDNTSPLAIMVGGVANECGLVFASDDWGCTWTQELHDCDVNANCTGEPIDFYADPPQKLDFFRTLYGVAINPTDNSAIACGYHAQHLRRPPGPPGTLWIDYSEVGHIYLVPHNGAVIFPQYGAEFSLDGPPGVTGYIVGIGGHVRTTPDGMIYTEHGSAPGDFRIQDAQFVNADKGTLTGQFFLLAETINGGVLWKPRSYVINQQELTALAFAGPGQNGVAVGKIDTANPPCDEPEIKYTINGGSSWFDANSTGADKELTAVAWDKGSDNKTFWAVGKGDLILQTIDGGVTWTTITIPGVTGFDMHSVAFDSPTFAIVVGEVDNMGTAVGTAYKRDTGVWTDISPSSGLKVMVITGVDALDGKVYAVGAKDIGNGREGEVLKLGMNKFNHVGDHPDIPLCTVGEFVAPFTEPLNAVKLVDTGPDKFFVAGQCGELWKRAGTMWTKHRSETSSHIRHLSVVPGGKVYAAAFRLGPVHSCITRLIQ